MAISLREDMLVLIEDMLVLIEDMLVLIEDMLHGYPQLKQKTNHLSRDIWLQYDLTEVFG